MNGGKGGSTTDGASVEAEGANGVNIEDAVEKSNRLRQDLAQERLYQYVIMNNHPIHHQDAK